MNKKLFSGLTIVAVALTLVLGLGTFNAAKALPGESGMGYNLPAGVTNMVGLDAADNTAGIIGSDADSRAHEFAPDSYGLRGTSQE